MFTHTEHAERERRPKQLLKTRKNTVLDPRRDSILEVHRNESLWTGILQEKIFIKENMGLGQEKVLFIDENVEIFASHVPSKLQINILCQAFKQYNSEYEKVMEYTSDRVTAILKYEGKFIAGIYGFSYKDALTVVSFRLTEEDSKLASMVLKCLVAQLAPRIKTIYISELSRDSWTIEALSALGFHIKETDSYNKINAWITIEKLKIMLKQYGDVPSGVSSVINRLEHYKKDSLEQENNIAKEFEALTKQFDIDFIRYILGQTEETDQTEQVVENDDTYEQIAEEIYKSITDHFMLLMKKDENKIIGGVLCKIEETHLLMRALWLHESMRGNKLSEKLVYLAEEYAKQKGCADAGLETASYQAPWLYPKLGYKQVSFLAIGPHAKHYYKKCL